MVKDLHGNNFGVFIKAVRVIRAECPLRDRRGSDCSKQIVVNRLFLRDS